MSDKKIRCPKRAILIGAMLTGMTDEDEMKKQDYIGATMLGHFVSSSDEEIEKAIKCMVEGLEVAVEAVEYMKDYLNVK